MADGHVDGCQVEWWRMDDGSIYESTAVAGAAWLVTPTGQRPARAKLIYRPGHALRGWLAEVAWGLPLVIGVLAWAFVIAAAL